MSTITDQANPALTGQLGRTDAGKANRIALILQELINLRRASEAKEVELKTELKNILKPAYFAYNQGAKEAEDVVHAFDIGNLQVNFTNSYFIRDNAHLQKLVNLLGEAHPLASTLTEKQSVTVDVSALADTDAKALAREIAKLTVDYKAPAPVVERSATTTQQFHDLRHVYLSPEDNLVLDKEIPIVIQVTPIGLN